MKDILNYYSRGGVLVVTDHEERENEGDFVVAASCATPQIVDFFTREGRGLLCVAMDSSWVDRLKLPMMSGENEALYATAFTVSVDAKVGITTGISAKDRSRTIQLLADPQSTRADFVVPGHVFPLKAAKHGLSEREGHTEAGVWLAKMSGHSPVSLICEILGTNGEMARGKELDEIARKNGFPLISIQEIKASMEIKNYELR